MSHKTLDESAGLGNGGFDLGYGEVRAGDLIESGSRLGQVIEIFHDGDCWVVWDDGSQTMQKWRHIRRRLEPV